MTKRKKYFKNDWKLIQGIPAETFESVGFDDFMDWKIGGYEIPEAICCIIREKNVKTGKVKEHVYQYRHAARKKAAKLIEKGELELVIVQRDTVSFIPCRHYNDII